MLNVLIFVAVCFSSSSAINNEPKPNVLVSYESEDMYAMFDGLDRLSVFATPSEYYEKYGDPHPNLTVANQSCKNWRVDPWTSPVDVLHTDEELSNHKYIIVLGPPKSATSFTMDVLSYNPNICYWRLSAQEASPHEARHIFLTGDYHQNHSDVETIVKYDKENLFNHLPPQECCKASTLKMPKWSYDLDSPLRIKKLFGNNNNVKIAMTVREPISLLSSAYNFFNRDLQLEDKQTPEEFVKEILGNTEKYSKCKKKFEARHPDLVPSQVGYHEKIAEQCNEESQPRSLYMMDYTSIFLRYSTLLGAENIFCQFLPDLAADYHKTNAQLLTFAGLADLILPADQQFTSSRVRSHSYDIALTQEDKDQLHSQYVDLFGEYDEEAIRNLCVHSSHA